MLKNGDINSLKVGEKIYLFKREVVIPIACALFEYFDVKYDKNADESLSGNKTTD